MLLLYIKLEFIYIIKIKVDNIYIFQFLINYLNITYFIIKYKEDKFKKRDIIIVYKLIKQKLKEYTALIKIIIYSNNIITI